MEEELASGEAPQVLKKETAEGTEYKRTQSSNPEYFVKLHDYYKGISKAYVKNIFRKAKNNEPLTPKQSDVLQSLLHAKTEEIESQKHYVREQLPKIPIGELARLSQFAAQNGYFWAEIAGRSLIFKG